MASIQKITSHGWRIFWRLYNPDGTIKEKYKSSKSKSYLQEILPDIAKIESLSMRKELSAEELHRALNLGIVSKEEVGQFSLSIPHIGVYKLDDLRMDLETKLKVQASSTRNYGIDLYRANKIEEWFKDYPLPEITPELIERYREDRRNKVSPVTVNHDLKLLRKQLDIAVHKGWIKDNPARKIKLLREERNRVPRCLYPDELKALFEHLEEYKGWIYGEMVFIVKALIYTGLRREELLGLKPDNIKLHLRQIHVTGKGKKTRVIGIHHSLMEEFERRVLQGTIVKQVREESVTRAVKMMFRKIGLPEELTLHSLRHTYISYMLERGITSKIVKEHAGHFNLSITERYTHALPSNTVAEDALDFGDCGQ